MTFLAPKTADSQLRNQKKSYLSFKLRSSSANANRNTFPFLLQFREISCNSFWTIEDAKRVGAIDGFLRTMQVTLTCQKILLFDVWLNITHEIPLEHKRLSLFAGATQKKCNLSCFSWAFHSIFLSLGWLQLMCFSICRLKRLSRLFRKIISSEDVFREID